jgi:hypothetical protein
MYGSGAKIGMRRITTIKVLVLIPKELVRVRIECYVEAHGIVEIGTVGFPIVIASAPMTTVIV